MAARGFPPRGLINVRFALKAKDRKAGLPDAPSDTGASGKAVMVTRRARGKAIQPSLARGANR